MIRIGSGYDVHKLVEGRKLIIGGVDIPHTMGLLGHSDADVLLHSISDALLGAAAMGDIGCLFPDNDEKYKAPKLRPYIDEMRRNIADACSLDVSCVSVKATTEEGLGFTGRREGISASAVCLIEK